MMFDLFKSKKTMVYGLTPKGKKRAEETDGRTPEGLIVGMIEDHGESTASEIARETHLDLSEVKRKLKHMRRAGLVTARAEEGEEGVQ